jgi:D-alanyl-lipoteichoic acid acyltransferase DltB (MBOAT superfamily)
MYFVPIYIVILLGTIIIDYFAGIFIEKSEGKQRKAFLVMSLIANIGVLAIFKYYNFFTDNLNFLFSLNNLSVKLPYLSILLPIGLSFHTFQAMSYTIEVYRGNQKAEHHFGIYSLYVMFYPQLVAGPIERPQNVLHQFYEKHNFEWEPFFKGMRQILWGLFKKVVIADRLALMVGNVYNQPSGHSGLEVVLATIFFSFQIYCDFSGYSDIALGCAEVMGFKLMTNFNKPYFSRTISEFWKRWHISLSTWFRDYLYISMGGNRVSIGRVYFNMFFVFLVSGFWHGANWTYIIWGAIHGFYLMMGILRGRLFKHHQKSKAANILEVLVNFCLVAIGWVFFRAANVKTAVSLIRQMGQQWHLSGSYIKKTITVLGGGDAIYGTFNVVLGIVVIFILMLMEGFTKTNVPLEQIHQKNKGLSWVVSLVLLAMLLVLGVYDNAEFIYFQF